MERELVCADDEHAAGAPCLDLSGAHSQGVDEAGTSGVQVERAGPACPKPVLHQRGCGGHDVIGRAGGDDDEVYIGRVGFGDPQSAMGGFNGHI